MKIAIYGYGNLGKGVESAVLQNDDVELFGIFSKRAGVQSLTGAKVFDANDIEKYRNDFDVLVVCSGSATELPVITPKLAASFNVVDSFDTHASIPNHFENVNDAAKTNGTLCCISGGWDPGLFSLNRLYASCVLPEGNDFTFWGKGVSQGHSDAIRRIPGVVDARQYTIPREEAIQKVREGSVTSLTTSEKHLRECFVVAEENADKAQIETAIKTMPNYFADYETIVHFISLDELHSNHSKLNHGGMVIRTGNMGLNKENKARIEYSLELDSNPEFTGSVLVAISRAVKRMHDRGINGCISMFDIAPSDLSPLDRDELRKRYL